MNIRPHHWFFAWLGIFALAALVLTGCGREAPPSAYAPAPLSGHLLLTGSSTMQPLVLAIAERFHDLHPGVSIEVQSGGSGRGVSDAREGKTDIGMASRTLNDTENDLVSHAIARDGVALIVNSINPVQALSAAQVTAIFTGKLRDWSEVGGTPGAIRVIGRPQERGSFDLFTQYYKIEETQLRAAVDIGDNADVITDVIVHTQAISFLSLGESERSAQKGDHIRLLPIAGVAASGQSIRSGQYPLTRPLILVTKGMPQDLAMHFIEFAQSAQVNDLVLSHGFIPYPN